MRLFDSRPGTSTAGGADATSGALPGGSITPILVTGRAGIPSTASAVSLNVTVVGATDFGFVTVYPCGGPTPNASNVNYHPGQTVPNAVITPIGANGAVCVYTSATTHLIIDVNGSFGGSDGVTPLRPARLFETRAGATTVDDRYAGTGVRTAGSITEVRVGGRGGVAPTAAAVSLNVTAINPSDHGYATVYPCDAPVPNASNLNYTPGETRPNAVITKLSSSGSVCIYTSAPTDLVIDVNAAFDDTSGMSPIVPIRFLDARAGERFAAGSITSVPIAGRAGIGRAAKAASLNVTAVGPTDFGYVTVYPCGEPVPNASNLNFRPGETSPNAVIARLGQGGDVCLFSSAATHLLVDVNASFADR